MDRRTEEILHAARQLNWEDRQAYLDDACGNDAELRAEIEALLAADDQPAPSVKADEQEPAGDATVVEAGRPAWSVERPGQSIDRYKLLELLGEGGFGTVWLAEQREPVKRRVALKIIKRGMDTRQVIARFEAERQALAMMDHPCIAKVFEAGATARGRPYFVMELVKGVPIVQYCDTEKLDTRQRLELFIGVCQAIQHAHQKGIIHRDIKPSNVLVTLQDGKPVPKVIDFGIAKATNTELTKKTLFTEHRQIIGTPEYMSPEQAEMTGLDIDTRSDIYALGVLLYELLTGTTPFNARDLVAKGFAEMMRIIREQEPQRPSTRLSELGEKGTRTAELRRADVRKLRILLRGDLDWIVMKCLEKDRTRRYDTATGLANDIQRHLRHEPVTAGPPRTWYRVQKFVRRNRAQVAAATVAVAALVLGMIGTSLGLAWALREKERAVVAELEIAQRADELEQIWKFQSSQLSEIDTELMGIRLRTGLLKKLRVWAAGRGLDGNAVEATLAELSVALSGVNFTDVALAMLDENIFERAMVAIEDKFKQQPLVKARLLQTLAETMMELGLLERAGALQAEALEVRRHALSDENEETLASINTMGMLLKAQGKLHEAELYLREALSGRRRVLGDEHPSTLISLNNMGALFHDQGKFDEAEPYLREVLVVRRRVFGDEHPETLTSVNSVGVLFHDQGKLDEAASYYHEALEGFRRVLGDEHPSTLSSLNNIGVLLHQQGKTDEAESYLREALEIRCRVFGEEHPKTLIAIGNMGWFLQAQGKRDEAEPYLRKALQGFRRVLGNEHPSTLNSLNNIGVFFLNQDKLDESEQFFREALSGRRHVLGDEHPSTLISLNNMGGLLRAKGKLDEAEPYYREAVAGFRRVRGDDYPHTLISIRRLSSLLCDLGRFDEAELLAAEAVASYRRNLKEDPRDLGSALSLHGQTLIGMQRFSDALTDLLEAQAILEAAADPDRERIMEVIDGLADLYDAWHAAEPDAGHDAKALEWRSRLDDDRNDPSDR